MRFWCTVAVVMVLLASACGGSSRLSASSYPAHLAIVAEEADAAQGKVEKGFQAASVPELVKVLTGFASVERHIGDEVAGLKSPKNAAAANMELASGFHETAVEVQTFVPRVAKMPTAKAAISFLQKTAQTKGGRELDDALASLKRLGYVEKVS